MSRVRPASHPMAAATAPCDPEVGKWKTWVGGWVDKKVKMMQSCFDNFSVAYLTN